MVTVIRMSEENDREDQPGAGAYAAVQKTPSPACGRTDELAPDVTSEVAGVCPRCTGTGQTCLIDLMYAEAFPSQRRH